MSNDHIAATTRTRKDKAFNVLHHLQAGAVLGGLISGLLALGGLTAGITAGLLSPLFYATVVAAGTTVLILTPILGVNVVSTPLSSRQRHLTSKTATFLERLGLAATLACTLAAGGLSGFTTYKNKKEQQETCAQNANAMGYSAAHIQELCYGGRYGQSIFTRGKATAALNAARHTKPLRSVAASSQYLAAK